MGSLIKILGIIVVCFGILIGARLILFPDNPNAPTKGETVATVIEVNQLEIPPIDQTDCKEYSIEINNGVPLFTKEEIKEAAETGYYVRLSDFDELKRTQTAMMCADEEHIMQEERENSPSTFEPTGWHRNAIYERCHLLMWKLSGPDDLKNLITGTEYFNQVEMLNYEMKVTGYLWDHPGNHVLYRVTPFYEGEELLARGVLMEAYSIEDDGAFRMCEFVYNAQPGSEVVYETGAYHMYESWEEAVGETAAASGE